MTPRDFRNRLLRRARRAGLVVPAALVDSLWSYYDLLSRWNRKINLTALNEPDEAMDRLLLEPLAAARHLPGPTVSVLDVGSGGGSPAIPLKLAAPGISLVMVEVKARKSAFLREAVRQLGLSDSRVENARYEELLTQAELHEALDVVTMRAVRVEARTLVGLQAFLAPKGLLFLFKGPSGAAASEETPPPPLSWRSTEPLIDSLQSRLVILSKTPVGR